MNYDAAGFWLGVFTAVLNAGALTFVGLQVRQGAQETARADAETVQERARRNREWSLRFYLETMSMRDAHKSSLPPDRDTADVAELIRESVTDRTKDVKIRTYLSLNELLATGVNLGILDEEIVDRFDGPAIEALWRSYRPWIERQRQIRGEPTLYVEIEELASRLGQRP